MGRRYLNLRNIAARVTVALGSLAIIALGTLLLTKASSSQTPALSSVNAALIQDSRATTESEDGESLKATDDVAYALTEETIEIDVLGNDTGPEGATLRIVSVTQPGSGNATISSDGSHVIFETPRWATVDEFDYTIEDDFGAQATARVAVAINYGTGSGAITGRVTNEEGDPIFGVSISAYAEYVHSGVGVSDHDGIYRVPGLASGRYRVSFTPSYGQNYLSEYYNNRPNQVDANFVDVDEATVSGIDAVLDTGSIIRGRVTDESGNPIDGIWVNASGQTWRSAITDANGNYEILALRVGQYTVSFTSRIVQKNYLPQWYNNKSSAQLADPITLAAKEIREGIDASLKPGGIIAGRVTDESGNPIANVQVWASSINSCCDGGSATTGVDGNYEMLGLMTGDYRVSFNAFDSNHLSEYFNDKADWSSSDPVAVEAGATTSGINAELASGAIISGHVTDESGQPIEGLVVSAFSTPCGFCFSGSARTDADGVYEIRALRSGSYKIHYTAQWTDLNFIEEWYNDESDITAADELTVTEGEVIEGIDAQLQRGGIIEGHVQDEEGNPVRSLGVSARAADDYYYAFTDKNGNYRILRLPEDEYRVQFTGPYRSDYFPQWFDGRSDEASADPVQVHLGETTSGINATLKIGATISGIVTDESGNALYGVKVEVYSADDGSLIKSDTTGYGGTYRITPLSAGTFKVRFSRSFGNYADQWWNDKLHFSIADPITLQAKEKRKDIDARMKTATGPNPTISGRVTDEEGNPLQGANVEAINTSDGSSGWGYTDASGNYQISQLKSGSYKVRFYPLYGSDHIGEWYNDKPNQATADIVLVAESVTGINASLAKGGRIAGRVTDENGTGIPYVSVTARNSQGDYFYGGWTDWEGTYQISGLPEGDYKVQFSPSYDSAYKGEWYDDKPNELSADVVHVSRGETTSNIDATLSAGGTIKGTVSNSSGDPIANAYVCAYAVDYGYGGGCSYTDSQGKYLIGGLENGTFKVAFYANSSNYRDQWYERKSNYSEADPVQVDSYESVTIDVTLESIPHELTANDDQAETWWLSPVVIDVLANDVVDDGVQSVEVASGPQYGTAIVNPDFTITYTPPLFYSPSDTFSYRVRDRDGDQATATVSINVKLLPIETGDMPTAEHRGQLEVKSLPPEEAIRSTISLIARVRS